MKHYRTVSTQFETDQSAQTLLRRKLPPSWVLRPQLPDFHLDYVLEIASEGELSGIQAGVQLKGTAPREPFKKAPRLPLKAKHVRYYVEKCTFPVFVFLADVANDKIFYVFVQKFAVQKLRSAQLNQKSVTLTFDLEDTLDDLTKFERAYVDAERFMRELRPGSIQSAIRSKKLELQAKDPRVEVDVDVLGGREVLRLRPLQPISLRTRFTPKNPADFFPNFKEFLETGRAVAADVEQFMFEGSPLFEELGKKVSKIHFKPSNRAEAELELSSDKSFHIVISGNLVRGTRFLTFNGTLGSSPLEVSLKLPLQFDKNESGLLTVSLFESRWFGQNIRTLSYFEQIHKLYQSFEDNLPLKFTLSASGNKIVEAKMTNMKAAELRETLPVINFIANLRTVFEHFARNAQLCDFREIDPEDFNTAAILASLITQKRFHERCPNFHARFCIDPKESLDCKSLEISFVGAGQDFKLMKDQFTLGPLRQTLSNFNVKEQKREHDGLFISLEGTSSSERTIEWIPNLTMAGNPFEKPIDVI